MTEPSEARLPHLRRRTAPARRDTGEPHRFVSYGAWEGTDAVRAWKSSPEFRERMAQVLQYVDDFRPTELDVVAVASPGTSPGPQES